MYFLHFIWLSKNRCPWEIINTWGPNPGDRYNIIVWRDHVEDSARETDIKILGEFTNKHLMDCTPKFNQKSDILRLEILYRYGGVYMDCDIIRLSNLCPLAVFTQHENKHNFYISWEKKNCISNSCICVTNRYNAVIKHLIDGLTHMELSDSKGWKSVCETTGPKYITKQLKIYNYSQELVNPYYYVNFGIDFSKQFIDSDFKITEGMSVVKKNKDLQYKFLMNKILGIQLWFGGKKITYNKLNQLHIDCAYKNAETYIQYITKIKDS